MKFFGTIDQLKGLVKATDFFGRWTKGKDKFVYRASSGAILNWWPERGTIYFQGPDKAATKFETAFSNILDAIVKRRKKLVTTYIGRDAIDAPDGEVDGLRRLQNHSRIRKSGHKSFRRPQQRIT